MKKMRLIFLGDIHSHFDVIKSHVKKFNIRNANIIQVGDFGVGFNKVEIEKKSLIKLNNELINRNIFVYAVRGNHDYKGHFDTDPFNLSNIRLVSDYTVLNISEKNILFIGGAVSVDRKSRYTKKQKLGIYENNTLGKESWWNDEIFDFDENKVNLVRDVDIVVSHTAPVYCTPDSRYGFGGLVNAMISINDDDELKTDLHIERNLITTCFEILKKNNNITHHYYGHFHNSGIIMNDNIKHRLLNINEFFEEMVDN